MEEHPVIELHRFWLTVTLLITATSTAFSGDDTQQTETERLFATRVLPILKTKCFACHGNDSKKLRGGLNLTSREAMLKGGDSGEPAVIAGKPLDSQIYVAITGENPDLMMPPEGNDKLRVQEIDAIRQWIDQGAPWPTPERIKELTEGDVSDVSDGVTVTTSGGLSPQWTNRKYKSENLWAYRPLKRPTVPEVEVIRASTSKDSSGSGSLPIVGTAADRKRAAPATNPIDAFIAEKLGALGIEPAPPADRRTLIRRATFDLLGLPPTPDEVEAFVSDPDPDEQAFAKVIDRLLESPHYGEQWGQHWLDVTRYADSSGFANDYERGNAWRYRDYVVRAFNANKRYDDFIREQIAGDEIDPDNPEMLVAVGFLRMGPWELTGMEVPKVARQRFLDDVTETLGQVFLAQPLQCARCHDHKFDPVPTRDYYRIQAALATTQLAERPAPFLPSENTRGFEETRYLETRKARYEATVQEVEAKQEAAARTWCAERGLEYIARAEGLREGIPESKLPPTHIGLDTRDLGLERIARKGLERLKWELDRYEPIATSVYSGRTPETRAVYAPMRMPAARLTAGQLEVSCILAGGNPFSPLDPVTPGVLSAVAGSSETAETSPLSPRGEGRGDGGEGWRRDAPGVSEKKGLHSIPTTIEGRRRALADWIASAQNPLTARVMVNRIWLWHFGSAIAGRPSNFGATGKKPTHPELLDWLASEFMECGWSVKAMHRLIMSSEAYRRASHHPDLAAVAAADPEGIRYAAFKPRRLAAEELRDAMLAVSGELNPEIGGIPVRPELNSEVALQPRQVMGTFATAWQPSPRPEERHRRSIYALKLSGLRVPFFEMFNQPSPESSCERRDASTVTPQVFSLFNSQATFGRALAFAARLLKETATKEKAIHRAFQLAFARLPTESETNACLEHWNVMTARHRRLRFDKRTTPEAIIREAIEENTGERFEFTEVLESAADFVSDLELTDADPELRGLMEVCLVLLNANEFVYLD